MQLLAEQAASRAASYVRFLAVPLAFVLPAAFLSYDLLLGWTFKIASSPSEGYSALPSVFPAQILAQTIAWLAGASIVLAFQIGWVWRSSAQAKRAGRGRFGLRVARSVLIVVATTALGSSLLWTTVDLALLRLGHEELPAYSVTVWVLAGLAAFLGWAVVAVVDTVLAPRLRAQENWPPALS